MAKFVMNEALSGEISSLDSAGQELTSGLKGIAGGGLESLKTSVLFAEEHTDIMELLVLYQQLIAKDSADLREMLRSTQNLDSTLGRSMK